MMQYSAVLSRNPENIADTGAGAWLCASGSQEWIGASPALVPYPTSTKTKANFISVGSRCASLDARCVQNSASASVAPPDWIDAAASNVPMNAKAIPIEQMIRYFHIASSERRLGCSEIRKALSSVVASMPTHMIPEIVGHQHQQHRCERAEPQRAEAARHGQREIVSSASLVK